MSRMVNEAVVRAESGQPKCWETGFCSKVVDANREPGLLSLQEAENKNRIFRASCGTGSRLG